MSTLLIENKYLLIESGIRDINKLAQRYDNAKIYFHQDLDGVTTAIAMKNYLEQHGIKVVETEVIQYGDKEFSIKKPMARGDIMPVLVDFATVSQCLLFILTTMISKLVLRKERQHLLDNHVLMLKPFHK